MKNIYLFLSFQCMNFVSVHAQAWTAQKVGIPMNVQMFNISAPDNNTVWASGYGGDFHSQPYWTYVDGNTTVARSNDGGQSWQQSTIDAGAGGSVTGLIAVDNLIAWAMLVRLLTFACSCMENRILSHCAHKVLWRHPTFPASL